MVSMNVKFNKSLPSLTNNNTIYVTTMPRSSHAHSDSLFQKHFLELFVIMTFSSL